VFNKSTKWKFEGATKSVTLAWFQDWTVSYPNGENIALVRRAGSPKRLGCIGLILGQQRIRGENKGDNESFLRRSFCGASFSMYCPEASRASATSAGWPTAHAKICSHSAVFCSTSRRQHPMHRPRTSLLPGRAPSAKAQCTSSNGSPLPRSCSRKPDCHVLMTRPDRLLNPATLACLFPCSRQVCPEVADSTTRAKGLRIAGRCTLSSALFLGAALLSQPTATEAVENP